MTNSRVRFILVKKIIVCSFILIIGLQASLFAVHNFTINGSDEITVGLSDPMNFYFEYESVGDSAFVGVSLIIQGLPEPIPILPSDITSVKDGGTLDSTGIDGIFIMSIDNFVGASDTLNTIIEFIDGGITDEVTVHFEPITFDYSISGTVKKEGQFWDIPLPYSVVYSFYNWDIIELISLFEDFSIVDLILAMMGGNKYFLYDITDILGNYEIIVPDLTPGIGCITGTISLLDYSDNFVPPPRQMINVAGHVTDIDFLYRFPDGKFQGIVQDEDGDFIPRASISIYPDELLQSRFYFSDSLSGEFSIPLLNGTYSYIVSKLGYSSYSDSVTIENGNVYEEITLVEYIKPSSVQNLEITMEDGDAILTWSPVTTSVEGDPIEVDSYRIYDTTRPDGVFIYIGSTSDTTYIDDSPIVNKKFYYVTAVKDFPVD